MSSPVLLVLPAPSPLAYYCSDSPVALVWEAVFPLLPLSLACLSLASQVGHN